MPKPKNATSITLPDDARELLDGIAAKYGWKTRSAALLYCIRRTADAEGVQVKEKEGGEK